MRALLTGDAGPDGEEAGQHRAPDRPARTKKDIKRARREAKNHKAEEALVRSWG